MSNINSRPPDCPKTLTLSAVTLAVGTFSSRILGFIRDVILARLLGTGLMAEAFYLALRIPNVFRDLVGEGAANSAVVPVLAQYQAQKDPKAFWQLVNVISLWALIILSVITLLGMIFAPLIVRLIAPGFIADSEKLRLAIDLTRIIFPYLVLIGLTAHSMAVLYTFRSFVSPAFSPCLFNVAVIVSALIVPYVKVPPTYLLAIGVLAGGVLQLASQIIPMRKLGMRFLPVRLDHPGIKQCAGLLVPRLFGSGVYQLNLLIDTFCASLATVVGAGGISAIYYANRLIQLPLAVFGFSLSTATLPSLSSMAAENDMAKFKHTILFSIKSIFFIMFPASVLMIVLSQPLVRVLFQRGAFDAYSTGITSLALTFYSFGLFGFSGTKILANAFYAFQDTQTPVKVAGGALVINAVLNVALMGPLKIGGIALASSIASSVGFLVLFYFLEKRLGDLAGELKTFMIKVMLASVCAGGAAQGVLMLLGARDIAQIVTVLAAGLAGAAGYWAACLILKVPHAQQLWTYLTTKASRP